MLPPYIIEQLRQREQAAKQERAQPQPHLEVPIAPRPRPVSDAPRDRGVWILDLG